MRHIHHILTVVLLCMVVASAGAQQKPSSQPSVNADAATLQDFRARLDAYIKLKKNVAKDSPRLKETSQSADISTAENVLAVKIRAVRKDAKPGDIFPPQVRALLRRLMYPELKGQDGLETKAAIAGDDAPPAVPMMKVNATYPDAAALLTVPPNLLARLPQLPMDVEYRIVGRHLILRDVDANIIVDFIPDAIR